MKLTFRSDGLQQCIVNEVIGDFGILRQSPGIPAQRRDRRLNTLLKFGQPGLPRHSRNALGHAFFMPSDFKGIPAQSPAGNVERLTDVDARFHSSTAKLADNLPGGIYEVRHRIYVPILRAATRCGSVYVRVGQGQYHGGTVLKGA